MANKKVSQLSSKPSVLVTDLFPIADPSTGQLYKTTISDLGTAIGSGVSSVNGLVGAVVLDTDDIQELVSPTNKWFTDTRARAALSASSPLAYNSGTGVFSIPQATGSQNGFLSSSDWTTFNAKQAALSGTGFVKISGTTISYDNSTYALDSAVVKLTGDQTVAGIKTFSSNVKGTQFTVGTPFDTSRSFSAAGNANSIALWLEEYTSTGGGAPDLFFNNGRGTISSKANIQVGDGLGGISWSGYVNANFNNSVSLGTIVTNIDATNNHANADFVISQSYNSSTLTENLRLSANGGVFYVRGNAGFGLNPSSNLGNLQIGGAINSSIFTQQGTDTVRIGVRASGRTGISLDSSNTTFTNRMWYFDNIGANGSLYIGRSGLDVLTLSNSGGVTLANTLDTGSDITIPNGSFYKAKRSTGSAAISVMGFTSGTDTLVIKGGTSGGALSMQFQDTANTIMSFYNSNVIIGKTAQGFSTPGSQFESVGRTFGVTTDIGGENIFLHRSGSNTGNLMAFFYNSGGVGSISTNGTTTTYNVTSDYRLKQDLKPIKGLDIVNKIKVYDYEWKSDKTRMDGVLAHELAEVLPYAVTGVKDGEQMQGVDYSKIVPVMVQAIKELKAKIETLENK